VTALSGSTADLAFLGMIRLAAHTAVPSHRKNATVMTDANESPRGGAAAWLVIALVVAAVVMLILAVT
jgi:hypothetical protein